MTEQVAQENSETGLIHAFLMNGKGGGRLLSWEELQDWTPDQGKIWVHFDYTVAATRNWLESNSGLDQIIIDALLTEDTRPRTTNIDDGLLITLRGVNNNPGADPEDMVSIRMWAEADRIISTRKRKLLSVKDLLRQLERGKGPKDMAEFIVYLTDRLVWRMIDTVDQLEEQIDDIEDKALTENPGDLRHDLSELRRQTIALRRYLSPERDALTKIMVEQVSWVQDIHRRKMREVGERLIQHIEDIDVVRERTSVMNEQLLSRLSEQLNQRMYVLSILSAIFLPLGFLTGLLGVNLGGIPGAQGSYAFWIFVGLLCVVVLSQLAVLRWKKWL
ncbi:zinc transporter ZntB [Hydrogenovibrio sp. JE_KL2]|uniref:zinc transporter ZntB n=1 Tax=Hydrogenovibrio sp. JE_KL2 TaxID=2651188 RepID=UPI00128E52B2|nr:zinc transporter ZntB [Hydrogenovibrio sp. JE_KL2]MPQ76552.1 zinc transporter ZntB [Hydrogenovibrio sp. JE_KL2]